MPQIGFIGAGITGTALAARLFEKGYGIKAVASRTLSSAQRLASRAGSCQIFNNPQEVADNCQFIFITTPDDLINSIANSVQWKKGQYVVHCSGALSLEVLDPAGIYGAIIGSLHPLQSFADVEQAYRNLPGSTFALEAEEPLLRELQEIVKSLQGRCFLLSGKDRALYHAGAVFASNYLVTLVKMAGDLFQDLGISSGDAVSALLPLLRGTLENIEKVGFPHCLTGPIARGDLGTIRKHLQVLQMKNPQILASYKVLGWHTIPIALAKGKINSLKAEEIKNILKEGKDEDND